MTGVPPPCGSSMRAATLSGPIAGHTFFGKGHLWPLGMASLARPLPYAQALRFASTYQGKVILAGSTFRREKMRLDPCTGTSISAQSRCSSTRLPPFRTHRRPALPE
jgi:hypothetical protein